MSYRGVKSWKSDTHAHTQVHISEGQLKIIFLDVSEYYEYSDSNIMIFFFHENIVSSMRDQKIEKNNLIEKIFEKKFNKMKTIQHVYFVKTAQFT